MPSLPFRSVTEFPPLTVRATLALFLALLVTVAAVGWGAGLIVEPFVVLPATPHPHGTVR